MSRFRRSVIVCLVSVCAAVTLCDSARGAGRSQVTLPQAAYDFAVDPVSGAVIVVNPNEDTVVLYPKLTAGSTAGAITRQVPKGPVAVVGKLVGDKYVYAVACHDGNKLVLFDQKLDVLKEISLAVNEPSSLMASLNPADPFIYYCGDRGHESSVGCVNALTLKDEGKIAFPAHGSIMDGAVSADGSVMYGRGPWSPSGFAASRILPPSPGTTAPRMVSLFYDHRSVAKYLPDPFGTYVSTSQSLYTADLKREVAKLPVTPVVYLEHKPIIIGFTSRDGMMRPFDERQPIQLQAVSYNTFNAVGESITLGANRGGADERIDLNPRATQADFKNLSFSDRFLYDRKSESLLCLQVRNLQIVPLADFKVPAEPLLYAAAEVPATLAVEQKASIKLTVKDPAVKVELQNAPQGMKLVKDALEWTPAADDVGVRTATIKLSGGGVERSQDIRLVVARDEIALPFTPSFIQLSSDVSAVIAAANRGSRDPYGGGGQSVSAQLVLVDLKARTRSAEREIMAPITAVGADSRYVYVGLRDSDAFYVLSRKDLSDVKRLFSSGRVQSFTTVSDSRLLVHTDQGLTVIDPSTLTPITALTTVADSSYRSPMNRLSRQSPGSAVRLADGWFANGMVFDATMEKVKSLIAPAGLVRVAGSAGARPMFVENPSGFSSRVTCMPWGVYMENNSLKRCGGQQVAQINQTPTIVLPTLPAAATLVYTPKAAERESTARGEIVFRDLVTGTGNHTIALFDHPIDAQRMQESGDPYGNSGRVQLLPAGDQLVALCYDRLYIIKNPVLPEAQFPIPLHFPADQGVAVLDPAKPVMQTLRVSGGQKVEFSLAQEIPGVDLDKAKGTLTLTAGPLLESAAESLAKMAQQGLEGGKGLAAYLPSAAARFKMITGREPQGIPVYMTLTISARDTSLQVAVLDYAILMEVPAALFEKKSEAAKPTLVPLRPTTQPSAGLGDGQPGEDRIDRLERKVRDLENRIDLLMRVLNERPKN